MCLCVSKKYNIFYAFNKKIICLNLKIKLNNAKR